MSMFRRRVVLDAIRSKDFGPKTFQISISHPNVSLIIAAKQRKSGLVLDSASFDFPRNTHSTRAAGSDNRELQKHAQLIKDFLDGRVRSLDDIPLDTSWCTPFQKRVLDAARKIPWGRTVSYSDLAKKAGYPNAMRAAASVMRNNRFPLIIPCHRVIGKGGKIGGFMGAKRGAPIELKRKLLAHEGFVFHPAKI